MRWLHAEPCVLHLDLKLENVFLDPNFRAKIGDFGISWITKEKESMREKKGENAPVGNMLHEAPGIYFLFFIFYFLFFL